MQKNVENSMSIKFFFSFILSFLSFHLNSQMKIYDSTFLKNQKIIAENFEKEKDYINSLNQYSYLSKIDSSSTNAIDFKNKINQLLPICRNLVYNELKGKWKIKQNYESENSILKNSKYLIISNNEIIFLDDKSKEIKYNLISNPFFLNIFNEFPSIKIDNEIWLISLRKINNETRLIWTKKMDKNENLLMTIDEREIIRDPEKRRIALENEIHTYFVKVR